jgi:hypothetical protein
MVTPQYHTTAKLHMQHTSKTCSDNGHYQRLPQTSERQILNLAKLFLSADQIDLYFIQINVTIRQFCGFDKILFFLLFSD